MSALYFGNSSGWGHGQGKGPWVMADLENGLWAGAQQNAPAPSINFTWVTAMAKGKHGGFALKGGNAQEGTLQTLHDGPRPPGYEIMKKQGSIILGKHMMKRFRGVLRPLLLSPVLSARVQVLVAIIAAGRSAHSMRAL